MNLFIGIKNADTALLNENESHHLTKVLRQKVGDKVLFTEGKSEIFEAEVLFAHQKNSTLKIIQKLDYKQKRDYYLHVAVAPTKQIDRIEWFIEKAVEIGIDEISFLESFHSERRNIKTERLERVSVAAIKQSLKAEVTKIHDLIKFNEFIAQYKDFDGQKFIAHCYDDLPTNKIENTISPKNNYLFLIGPEGDFSKEEVEFAMENGFTPISFGNQRMRTETAALNAAFIANWVNK